jgi:hypothetical protein
MRARQNGWLKAVGVGCLLAAAGVQAQTNTDRPGSILMFPKVVRDGLRDTKIQITNTGNMINRVHCLFLNGAPGRSGAPQCTSVDFDLSLTRQQPTQWMVSMGRPVNPGDANNGYDPGLIPPVPVGFTGALICMEVDVDGIQLVQNRLKGEATLVGASNGDVSKYNAVTALGGTLVRDNILSLNDGEYERCPTDLHLNIIADGSLDPAIEAHGAGGGLSSVATTLTLLPCDLNFQNGVNTSATVSFEVFDEFEIGFSGSFPIDCWASFNVGTLAQFRSLLQGGNIATLYAHAVLESSEPLVAVAETFHADSQGTVAAAAVNVHNELNTSDNANIVLP